MHRLDEEIDCVKDKYECRAQSFYLFNCAN